MYFLTLSERWKKSSVKMATLFAITHGSTRKEFAMPDTSTSERIELRGGKGSRYTRGNIIVGYAMVDADIYPELNKLSWCLSKHGYPVTSIYNPKTGKQTLLLLHQLVWELKGNTLPVFPITL